MAVSLPLFRLRHLATHKDGDDLLELGFSEEDLGVRPSPKLISNVIELSWRDALDYIGAKYFFPYDEIAFAINYENHLLCRLKDNLLNNVDSVHCFRALGSLASVVVVEMLLGVGLDGFLY